LTLLIVFHILKYGMSMLLHPQDVVVLLKLVANRKASKRSTYAKLSEDLFMSTSQVFRSVKRTEAAQLIIAPAISPDSREELPRLWPNSSGNLKEFLIHGVKYAFPVERGGPTRGILTAGAAPPLNQQLDEYFPLPPVWPYPEGSVRGIGFSPLHENVPQAALRDQTLYELLALVDAIREGRAREREIAIRELTARIDSR
jgi:hypothetical protein